MTALEIFKKAHKEYYYASFPRQHIQSNPFDRYFRYVIDSLITLNVTKCFISGTQGSIYTSEEDVKSNLLKLDRPVLDDGYWLWCYECDTDDFDLIHFRKVDSMKKVVAKLKESNTRADIIVLNCENK